MARFVHLIDRNAATWSALAAVGTLARGRDSSGDVHEIFVRGRPGAWDRAQIAGVAESANRLPSVESDSVMIAWDDASAAWCAKRGRSCITAPQPVPIDVDRIQSADRDAIRRRLGAQDGDSVVAFSDPMAGRDELEYLYIRAAALALAGRDAIWVGLHPFVSHLELDDPLRSIGVRSRVVSTPLAPWSILVASDLAVFSGDNADSAELRRWADATRIPVISATEWSGGDLRRCRFEATRSLFAALGESPSARSGARAPDTNLDQYITTLVKEASPAQTAHSS